MTKLRCVAAVGGALVAFFVAVPKTAGARDQWQQLPRVALATVTTTVTSTIAAPPTQDAQSLLDAALARVPRDVWAYLSARGWTMRLAPARRGFVGGTWREQMRSAVFVRPTMGFDTLLGSVAHEVGHMVDFECFNDDDRNEILAARGMPTWWPTSSGDDRNWGVGDWAEVFAFTVTGRWDGKRPSPGIERARDLVAAHGC